MNRRTFLRRAAVAASALVANPVGMLGNKVDLSTYDVGIELMHDINKNLESILIQHLAKAMADAEENAIINGV
jgi:hypothetical protein